MSRLRLIAPLAFAVALALPGSVLAATVDAGGTVTATGGGTVAGVEVLVLVQGTDQVVSTTTDDSGAWGVQVDADAGSVLEVSATGPTVRSEPDAKGCVTLTTPTGRVTVTIEELPLPPIEVPLDGAITGQVCSATATPDAGVTPPPTDGPGPGARTTTPGTALLVLLLAGVASIGLTTSHRRTTRRRARR